MIMTVFLVVSTLLALLFNFNFVKLLKYSQISWKGIHTKNETTSMWKIPGPLWLPFFGTKWVFIFKYKISKLHEAYKDFNKLYGPIALEITPGNVPIVHLFNRQDIEKVLKYPSKHPFRPPTEIVVIYRKTRPDRYASTGIANEQGEKWYHLRSTLTPHITSPRTLCSFLPVLNSICNDFIDLLKSRRNSVDFSINDFQEMANLLGLEAVCTLTLGRRMGYLSKTQSQPKEVKLLADAVKNLFIAERDSYYGLGLWKHLPTKTYKNFLESEETIYNIISDIVDNALIEDELDYNDSDLRSVFTKILQTENLDLRDKKSAIIDFIAAGIETLANTLIFALYYISEHKNATNKICAEFEENSDNITQANLSSAVYTKACLHEGYRIHPTAFCLARILETDTVLSGFDVKAGTIVLCQNMLACQQNENFEDANFFKPERWLLGGKVRNAGASIVAPFGIGKRTCPGKRFVEVELMLAIAKMCLSFNIKFPEKMETDFEFLLAPVRPVKLILKDRK